MEQEILTLGIPKGRLMETARSFFARCGVDISIGRENARSVLVPTSEGDIQLCPVRSKDVPMLLESGAVDIALIGGDMLYEARRVAFGSFIELDICNCRQSVIAAPGTRLDPELKPRPRVATKFPRLAREFFTSRGFEPEIIDMNGSVELALLLGLADFAVDIVGSGETIARNGLIELQCIKEVGAVALLSHRTVGERRERCKALLDLALNAPSVHPGADNFLFQANL